MLLRNKPWLWKGRLGVHSKIRKSRHQLKVQQYKRFKVTWNTDYTSGVLLEENLKNEYYQFLVYKWGLDLLLFFLERSAVSLEMANVLRGCTFTTMMLIFPRKIKVAKRLMRRYILRVESEMSDDGLQMGIPNHADI